MPPTQEQVNDQGMSLTDLSINMSEGQAAANRIAANRASKNAMSGSVSANQLKEGAPVAPVTPLKEAPPVDRGVIDRSAQQSDEVIRATTQQSRDLDERRAELAAIAGEGSLQDMFTGGLADAGVPGYMKELTDIQLQLADRGTQSEITKARIAGAGGQTMAQGGREITQEGREAAIRDAGLAARAQVLQGNIETASTLVNQAVTLAYQDRTLRNTNLINQINDLRGVVDDQTQQILDKEQRKYEEDQINIEDTKNAVDVAINTGAATSEQIETLTDPNATDEKRLKTAQEVIASSSAESRNLELQKIKQSMAASSLSAKKSRLDLCQSGDASYCGEFNIDTEALTEEEIAERINNQNQSLDLQSGMTRLQGVMDNDAGLQMSSGSVQSPFLSGAVGGPAAGIKQEPGSVAQLVSMTPIVGNIVNYNTAKEAKEQFIGDVQYLLSNRVFEKVAEIKSAGYAGAISDTELGLMANASSALNALAIKDDGGNIIGFRGGEENLRRELDTYMDIYERANDALNIKALQTTSKNDIINAYNE